MTNRRATLLALADRLEAGETGHRIDGLIGQALDEVDANAWFMEVDVYGEPVHKWTLGHYGAYGTPDVQPYTTSLDAAQGLHERLLPGWGVDITLWRPRGVLYVRVWGGHGRESATAPTPAAAWIAAILRAVADEEKDEAPSEVSAQKAAEDMRALCAAYSGHKLHQEADRLMCELMRAAGYGDAVDVFLQAIGHYHEQDGAP